MSVSTLSLKNLFAVITQCHLVGVSLCSLAFCYCKTLICHHHHPRSIFVLVYSGVLVTGKYFTITKWQTAHTNLTNITLLLSSRVNDRRVSLRQVDTQVARYYATWMELLALYLRSLSRYLIIPWLREILNTICSSYAVRSQYYLFCARVIQVGLTQVERTYVAQITIL